MRIRHVGLVTFLSLGLAFFNLQISPANAQLTCITNTGQDIWKIFQPIPASIANNPQATVLFAPQPNPQFMSSLDSQGFKFFVTSMTSGPDAGYSSPRDLPEGTTYSLQLKAGFPNVKNSSGIFTYINLNYNTIWPSVSIQSKLTVMKVDGICPEVIFTSPSIKNSNYQIRDSNSKILENQQKGLNAVQLATWEKVSRWDLIITGKELEVSIPVDQDKSVSGSETGRSGAIPYPAMPGTVAFLDFSRCENVSLQHINVNYDSFSPQIPRNGIKIQGPYTAYLIVNDKGKCPVTVYNFKYGASGGSGPVIISPTAPGISGNGAQLDTLQAGEIIKVGTLNLSFVTPEADAKEAAELKAKQDSEVKAAADKAAAELKAKQDAEARAATELKRKQDAEARAAIVRARTITCIKGKLTKKVTAVQPKCPAGYKVKK